MSREIIIFSVLGVYLLIMIGIGFYGRKNASTFTDTITAAKKSNLAMITFSVVGANIGSGFVVGGATEGATWGLAGMWYALGCGAAYIIAGLLLVKFAYRNNYLSLSQYFLKRYNDRGTRLIFSITTPIAFAACFAGQILAGKAVFQAFGIDGNIGLVLTSMVVLFYASLSGLWGAYMTSVIQSVVILGGLIISMFFLLGNGGMASLTVENLGESAFNMVPFSTEQLVLLTLPTVLSTLTDQSVFQRMVSAKTEKTAYWGYILGGLCVIILAPMPALLGMYGRVEFPGVEAGAMLMTVLLERFPVLFGAIMVAAIISAIMSTCDGCFLGSSTCVVGDIYKGMFKPDATDKECLRMTYVCNICICILGILCALVFTNIINLLSVSYTILFGGCLVPFVGGLVWARGTAKGAIASSVCGVAAALLGSFGVINIPYASIFPLIPAIIAYVVVSLMTKNNEAGASGDVEWLKL